MDTYIEFIIRKYPSIATFLEQILLTRLKSVIVRIAIYGGDFVAPEE